MKIPERIRAGHLLLAALPLFFLAGWSGHFTGRWQAGREDERNAGATSVPALDDRRDDSIRPAVTLETRAKESAERLLAAWQRSPDPHFDFELAGDLERILGGLSAEEIAAVYRLIEAMPGALWNLRQDIVMAWALKDGPSALAALKDTSLDRHISIGVFRNWMLERPKEALTWLRDGEVPPALSDQKEILLLNSLNSFVKSDPEFAFGELSGMERKQAVNHLATWVDQFSSDEALRGRAWDQLEALATPEELAAIRRRMLLGMARKDPATASTQLEAMEIPEVERSDLETRILIEGTKLPAAGFDQWMTDHPEAIRAPVAIQERLSEWLAHKPDEAKQWLDELPAGALRDGIFGHSARHLFGLNQRDEAAALAAKIEDPEIRSRTLLKLDRLWSDTDPSAAAAWRGSLSDEDLHALDPR